MGGNSVTAVSGNDWIEEMLGDIDYNNDDIIEGCQFPFKMRVGVPYRRPPRHPFFEYFRDMGVVQIDQVFSGEPFRAKTLCFVFPERWMNVSEQRHFTYKLGRHPDAPNLEVVDIITHSPLIIGGLCAQQIRKLNWQDDKDFDYEGTVDSWDRIIERAGG